MRKVLFFLEILFSCQCCFAFEPDSIRKRLNIVVSTKASRPDPAVMSFHTQVWWNQLFHNKKFRFVIAKTMDEAVTRISEIMKKENAMIGNMWFDSHGHMGRRVSLLELGDVELNYQSIKEPWIAEKLMEIGVYCDSNTRISLGSCYSGAAYYSAGIKKFPPQRMNGDSLMRQMSEIMNHATVFGSVSWVTTKLGLFRARYASAGGPLAKRFKDPRFKHAWDSLGIWKAYNANEGFRYVNTVSLDHDATIRIAELAFLDIPSKERKQEKMSKRLKDGNFSSKYFYQYRDPLHVKKGKEMALAYQ
jgi:hypothetical protein